MQERYDVRTNTWTTRELRVAFDGNAFAKGGMRAAYRVKAVDRPDGVENFCAKCSLLGDDESAYKNDVETQQLAAFYADLFNERKPAKQVLFVEASLINRLEAPPGEPTLFAFEPMISGEYQKWTDNQDWRNEANNTPHAFCHFTYCRSKGTLLICDLQGVAVDEKFYFTDPQIHSQEQEAQFGKGNLGVPGMKMFFRTHTCNAVCRQLGLPLHQPQVDSGLQTGEVSRFPPQQQPQFGHQLPPFRAAAPAAPAYGFNAPAYGQQPFGQPMRGVSPGRR